jgi:PAS domain S-box-containing protein
MSIRKHILSALIFVLVLTFISFGTSIYYLNKIGSTSTQILQEDYQSVKAAEELIISLSKLDRALVMLCVDSTSSSEEAVLLKIVNSEWGIIRSYLSAIEKNIRGEEPRQLYVKLKESYDRYERSLNQVPTARDQDQLYLSVLRWQSEVLRSNCSDIVEKHHALLKEKNEALQKLYLKAKINTFLASILVLLVIGVVLDKIPDWIIRPIGELTEKVKRLVQNDSKVKEEDIEITSDHDLEELTNSIKLAGQRIKESEEKILLITENLYDIIFFTKPDGEIFYTTPSIQRVVGYTPEEITGMSVRDLLHPEDVKQAEAAIRMKGNSEIRVQTKRNCYLWLEVNQTVHKNEDGQVLYAQYTARDISKRKKAEERIRRALIREKALNEELTRANHELDKFVYSASHNLRSPLTSMMGLLSLLRLASRKQERNELVKKAEESVFKLDETIKEIIEYSRNGRMAIEVGPVNFEEIIVETIRDLQYLQPQDRPVDISYRIAPKVQCVSDSSRIKMVFVSLVSNAIKYYNPDEAKPTLKITVSQSKGKTKVVFKDNGEGIKEKQQSRIFDMFYRASEQAYGAGLGLYITKSTVEKLEGEVVIDSVYQKGTTITVIIPNLENGNSIDKNHLPEISSFQAREIENS